ncbi:hypothetical protein ACFQDF_05895 [Ectobacillus funiculus]
MSKAMEDTSNLIELDPDLYNEDLAPVAKESEIGAGLTFQRYGWAWFITSWLTRQQEACLG